MKRAVTTTLKYDGEQIPRRGGLFGIRANHAEEGSILRRYAEIQVALRTGHTLPGIRFLRDASSA